MKVPCYHSEGVPVTRRKEQVISYSKKSTKKILRLNGNYIQNLPHFFKSIVYYFKVMPAIKCWLKLDLQDQPSRNGQAPTWLHGGFSG